MPRKMAKLRGDFHMRKVSIKKNITIFIMIVMLMVSLNTFTVAAASPEEMGHLPVRVIFEENGATVEWNNNDHTIHIELMGNVIVFHTRQPMAYANNNPVPLQDGIVLWEDRSFITQNDLAIIMQALNEEDGSETVTLIITGRYGHGTPEENEMVASILGRENTHERFNIYFNWFNTVHEIGHIVEHSLQDGGFGFLESEIFANSFAAAFWAHYGDEDTFSMLREIVSHAVENIDNPLGEGDIYDFARLWEAGELEFSFEVYGWFQFNLVNLVLSEMRDLETLLKDIGMEISEVPPQRTLELSSLGEESVPEILVAVFTALRNDWGIEMPANIYSIQSDEPHAHATMTLTPLVVAYLRAELGLDDDIEPIELLKMLIPLMGLGEAGDINLVWSVRE